jgi:hypothetical protein
MEDALKLKGDVFITVKDKDGNIKEERHEKNLVVSAGLNFICDRMEGASEAVMSHMGLGSGSTAAAAGDTDLESLLGSREALDSTTVSTNTITYVSSFEAGDATGSVVEAGIFNASTSGTMLCRVVFGTITKAADDTMSVTWVITLNAS